MTIPRKFTLDIYDKRHKIVTQFAIPQYLKPDYIRCPSTLSVWIDGVLLTQYDIPDGSHCQGCDKPADECPGSRLLVSNTLVINHIYGYPIKICAWCKWWMYVQYHDYPIDTVPVKFRTVLYSGHIPKNVVARL